MTPQRVGKLIIIFVMLSIIIWFIILGFDKVVIKLKQFSKITADPME